MAGLVGAGRTNVARAIFGVEPPTSRQDPDRWPGGGDHLSRSRRSSLGWRMSRKTGSCTDLIPAMRITPNISLPMLQQHARSGWLQDEMERKAAYDAALQMEVRAHTYLAVCA